MDGVRQLDGGVVEFLPTKRQLWALSALGGVVFVAAAAILFVPALVADPIPWAGIGYNAVLAVAFGTLICVFAPRLMGRNGIAADHLGIRRNRGLAAGFASWDKIVDIRAERSFGRDRVVVYLDSGRIWRLPTPYDGRLLAHDPEFATKVETLRGAWATRRAGVPG
jgi:hypothetical protein